MKLVETHIVKDLTARIRIQEYGPLVFKTLPTRSSVKKAIKKNLIYINDKVANTADWVENNQTLTVYQEEKNFRVFKLKLAILFEDEHIAIINKPTGYPTSGNYFKTIENALSYNLTASNAIDALQRPLPAHRLDNATSGLLIVAKTKAAHVDLNFQFQNKIVRKEYIAILEDKVKSDLKITLDIDTKPSQSTLNVISHFERKGKVYTFVKLYPNTGRTHQLRIHCASIKAPIYGDGIYGIKQKQGLMLHASGVSFIHPETQENVNFNAQLPKRFKNFISPS